jgi:nitroimidazol reductase NimA-like FMN-containing flavoprotein (pyridoxamine 5'-phosphate oxidase superfamily)
MEMEEIKKLLREQMICRIAFNGDKYPYLIPFQYVLVDESLYFHFTDYGKKMRLLERDRLVCVEIEKYSPDLSSYNFVVFRGELEVIGDSNERTKVINKIAKIGKQKLSPNFLAVHGLKKEEGWNSFSPKRPLVIVKLKEVTEIIGLKSPD